MTMKSRTFTIAGAMVLALCLAMPLTATGQQVDPFYQQRLDDGLRAQRQGDPARAAQEIQLAAFGLLDHPDRLAKALSHLAVLQNELNDLQDLESTYRRLLDLEARFGAYSKARLSDEVRVVLDTIGDTLPAQQGAERLPSVAIAIATGGSAPTPAPSASTPAPGETVSPPSAEELDTFYRLDSLTRADASTRSLREGFSMAETLADRHPDWAELQRVAGLLASRSGSYAEAVRFYDRAGDAGEQRPEDLFYQSIALYETDRTEQAATLLRRALPALQPNPEVQRYVRRILRQEEAG